MTEAPNPHSALAADSPDRARLLRFARSRGITDAALAEAARTQGDLFSRYVEFLGESSGTERSLEEAAELLGLDVAFVQRLWVAGGLGDQHEVFDDDLESLRGVVAAIDAGFPADALLQIARVFGDALGRVADVEVRLFHFHIQEQLRASGLRGDELSAATTKSGERLLGLIEPTILYYHRKAWQRALREDLLLHLAQDVAPADAPIGQLTVAVMFVDLSGFTALTESMGDVAAAGILDRFSDLVRLAAANSDGRVTKQIGDEFMLVFPDATAAVVCGLAIAEQAAREHAFPKMRMGAHSGTVLYRDGDYLGTTVNVAARAAGEAQRGEFVVTTDVRTAARDLPAVQWVPLGAQDLRGLSEPIDLYRVHRPDDKPLRVADPVCSMELDPQRCAFRTLWHGRTLWFCSESCRERFLTAPERYREP